MEEKTMKPSIFYSDIFKPEVMQPKEILRITNIEGLTPINPVEILEDVINLKYLLMDFIQCSQLTERGVEQCNLLSELKWKVIDRIIN